MITSSPVGSPCVRNVFVIERADPKDGLGSQEVCLSQDPSEKVLSGFEDDTVHYGQNIRIKLCPFSESAARLCAAPMFHWVAARCFLAGSKPMLTCTAKWSPDWQLQSSPGRDIPCKV